MLRVSAILNVMRMRQGLGLDPVGSACDEHRGALEPHPAYRVAPPRPPVPEPVDRRSMESSIARSLGRLGVGGISAGSLRISAEEPESVPSVEGCGDSVRPGDVVLMGERRPGRPDYEDPHPWRLLAAFAPEEPGLGPSLLLRRVDDVEEAAWRSGPTSCIAWSDESGCRRTFRRPLEADVDSWWASAKAPLPDGWHSLDRLHMHGCRFRTEGGIPSEVVRRPDFPMRIVAALAGQVTGCRLKMTGRYSDPGKTMMAVRSAERASPPVVHAPPA